MKTINAYSYVAGRPLALTRAEWRRELAAVIATGGRRRVENGETLAHARDGRLAFEVYAILPEVRP